MILQHYEAVVIEHTQAVLTFTACVDDTQLMLQGVYACSAHEAH
jgi:hypothetical protein